MLATAVHNIASNPLFERLTRREIWPDVKACLRLALIVTLVGFMVIALAVLSDPLARHAPLGIPIPNYILILNAIIRILSIPLLATLIVNRVIRAIEQGEFSLVQISRMTNGEIIEGFITSGLYKLRIAWAMALGLALPTLAAIFYQNVRQMRRVYLCDENTLACLSNARTEFAVFQFGIGIFSIIVDYAVYYGWVWLVSYGSVWLALRLRTIGPSTGALALPLVALVLYLVDSYSVIGLSINPLPSAFPTFGYCGTGLVLPLLLLAMKDHALGRVRPV